MTEKHYDTDWAKAKSRVLVREVCARNFSPYKKGKDLYALILPGRNARELYEVLDPLGVPRDHVTGLERDKKLYEEIKAQHLGINLLPLSVEEYARPGLETHFDIISLDYTGPLNVGQLDALSYIAKHQHKDRLVIHMANLARRDHNSLMLYGYGMAEHNGQGVEALMAAERGKEEGSLVNQSIEQTAGYLHKKDRGEAIKGEREIAHSILFHNSFNGGNHSLVERVFRFFAGENYLGEVALIEDHFRQAGIETHIDPEHLLESTDKNPIIGVLLQELGVKYLKQYCDLDCIAALPAQRYLLLKAINESANPRKCFTPTDGEKYTYLSESGDPMIGEVVFASYQRRGIEKAQEVARNLGFPFRWNIRDRKALIKSFQVYQEHCLALSNSLTTQDTEIVYTPHQFLGNASKPVLSKRRFIEELEAGASMEGIRHKYRGWDNKPLAQWKAHHTMGTYTLQMPEESPEDGDIDKITQDEALDFLKAGIPPEEIVGTFPTSFSLGQLRAFKAHLTMGTYQKRDAN